MMRRVKAFFAAIRKRDLARVRQMLDGKPELANAVARQPPKKDDGQSPLQIAFKTGNFEIADLLIDRGADVNYIETEGVNAWKAPVIHDAIRACVFSSRAPAANGFLGTKEAFEKALASLTKLIAAGADVHAKDSYGNNCMMRAALDASQLQIAEQHSTLLEDLGRLFQTLVNAGADFSERTDKRSSVMEEYAGRPVARFFTLRKQ